MWEYIVPSLLVALLVMGGVGIVLVLKVLKNRPVALQSLAAAPTTVADPEVMRRAVADAEKVTDQAQRDAARIVEQGGRDAERLVEQGNRDAERVAEQAKRDAERVVKEGELKLHVHWHLILILFYWMNLLQVLIQLLLKTSSPL